MCMLYGFNSKKRYELNNSLREFFSHSDKHPHGWGLAIYNQDKPALIKEPESAHHSEAARMITVGSIAAKLAIGHIRYKTFGEVEFLNTHPFVKDVQGHEWVFAHNGSVSSPLFKKLSYEPDGSTDSEKIFCYIIERLEESKSLSLGEQIITIERCVQKLAKYGKLNLLMTDGTHLFVHSNCRSTLYFYKKADLICFSTQPLIKIARLAQWKPIELNRLMVYKDGEEIYKGNSHGQEYKAKVFSNNWRWVQ